ncbi:MAG: type IV pilus modification protein PilV [Halioglobus sp.]|nr:type IV pilus modification protein PilV [Halioglobus sp.]
MLPAPSKACSLGGRRQSGFTLIEVMISAVILSIGVLGIAGVLMMSKVYQHESIQRTLAVELADGIFERIRRNPAGVTGYDTGLQAPLGNASIADEPDPDCRGTSCDATQLASHDLWDWEQLLDGASATVTEGEETINTVGLRNVRACIDFTADAGRVNTGIVDVVIQWQGLKETSDAVAANGVVCGEAGDEDATWRQLIVSSYVIDETEL